MKYIIDIESNGLLQDGLDYSTLPYKLKDTYKIWCVVLRHVDTGTVKTFHGDELTKDNLQHSLRKCTELVGHNIVQFDLPVLMLYGLLDYEVGYPDSPSTLYGKPVVITDTLLWSKLLSPDRFGGHSLKAWGKRLGDYKGDYNDWSKFSQEMLDYCVQDTQVNSSILSALIKEQGSNNWLRSYNMEIKLADLTLKQELLGFDFDVELAQKNLDFLNARMAEIAVKVNPLLPPKKMSAVDASFFELPKLRFKKDGSLSANLERFLTKTGAVFTEQRTISYEGKEYPIDYQLPLRTHEEATIENIDVVKGYLISLGWTPVEVKERDLMKNTDKSVKNYEQAVEAIDRYVKQTETSLFKELRLEMLNVNLNNLKQFLINKIDGTKPIYIPTTPKLTVGLEKEICPNLIALGEKAEFVKDVVEYYTYRHRRNAIAGGELDEDGEPVTGFLSCVREDGRVPTPADTLGANTGRYRHKVVCNIPRNTSLFGTEMRSMFRSGKPWYQLGYDFASLEARIEGHYVLPYTGGEQLARALLAVKPNDIHCFSQDTEILTLNGWKTFDALEGEKVAQYEEDGTITFVTPLDKVWEKYEGVLLEDEKAGFMVTPNHRVPYYSFSEGLNDMRIVEAKDLKVSNDKRYAKAGYTANEPSEFSSAYLRLLVAVQADGHFAKDCSAIVFSFVKQRKIERLCNILEEVGANFTKTTNVRKGREEVSIRLPSSEFTCKIRQDIPEKKFSNSLLKLSLPEIKLFLTEIKFWDGTEKPNGDVVLDTTCVQSGELVATLTALGKVKTKMNTYIKKTKYGSCQILRIYLSNVSSRFQGVNALKVVKYEGFVGCVAVPSGCVLVRRNGKIVVSGNTLTAKKMGISRDHAKSVNYAVLYGAQAAKLVKMLGVNLKEAKRIYNAFWEANPALKELKEKVEAYWVSTDKKYIKGLDERLVSTRSKHSLINVLFQSGGAISAKWSAVRLAQEMENQGILGNPFVNTKEDVAVWWLIHQHDEQQMGVHPALLEIVPFATEEEAKEYRKDISGAIGQGKKGYYVTNRTLPIDCIDKGITQAAKELELRVELGFEYITGGSWGQCH